MKTITVFSQIIFTLLIFNLECYPQKHKVLELPEIIKKQLPKNFELLDIVSGDLNKNEKKDYLIALKSSNITTNDLRPLYVFVDNNLFCVNQYAIGSIDCGGMYPDCYKSMAIKNEYFSIEFYGGSGNNKWLHIVTFKYDKIKNELFLTRYSEAGSKTYGIDYNYNKADSFVTSKDFGIITFKDYNYNNDYFNSKIK